MTSISRIRLSCCAALSLAWLLPAAAGAQSLADVARAEEARRKQVPKTAKVYTNESLVRDLTTPTTPATPTTPTAPTTPATATIGGTHGAPAAGSSSGTTAPAPAEAPAAAAPAGEVRDQAYWRDRIGAARAQLERSKTFGEALQSRVAALTTDFVNRDDPAQRNVIEQNRLKALAELERVQREIASQTKAITAIEDEARKAGVPAGWLR